VLTLPHSGLRSGIAATRAVELLKERIERGELLLDAEVGPSALPRFRRDVLRWQRENEELVRMLFEPEEILPNTAAGSDEELSETRIIESLKDDVSSDLGTLNSLVARLELQVETNADFEPVLLPDERPAPSTGEDDETSDEPSADRTAEEESAPDPDAPVPGTDQEAPPASRRPTTYSYESVAALASYDADAVANRDLVGIERVVDAFAYLMAARTLHPPLAIGLFGEWGSGKSFLMAAIRRRVDEITQGARQSGRGLAELGVFKRVVQIEFNAWHYVEGNLWASLVDHILSNLRTSADEETTELERRKTAIAGELASTRDQQRDLNRRLKSLKEDRTAKQKEVTNLQARRADKLVEVQQLRVSDIAAVALDEDDRAALDDALGKAGLTAAGTSAAEAARRLEAARDVAVRGSTVRGPMRRYGWRWVALFVLAVAIAPLTAIALDATALSDLTKALASVGAFFTAVAAVAGAGARLGARALDKIEAAQARVDQRVEQAAQEHAKRIAKAEETVAKYDQQIAEAVAAHQAAAARIEDLNRQLDELSPGKLLAEFLERRTTSGDYRKHLGLTALIRRDFEELSKLVADNNQAQLKRDATSSSADFNRIVLYVDDLDRCPPRRVVEVLQAVHLLLSFSVFVVVVAVDPRWLAQSLEIQYRDLLGADGVGQRATPDDYLEKIFQIPFQIAPLDIGARTRFVTGLLDADLAPPPDEGAKNGEPSNDALPERAATGDAADVNVSVVEAPATPVAADGDGREVAATVDRAGDDAEEIEVDDGTADDKQQTDAGELHEEDLSEQPPLVVDLNPASLRFTPDEAAFLGELLPLLDTSPRSLKRYVNIYRLIKSVAAIEGARTEDAGPAPFEAAMLLLAVQSGLEDTGRRIVRRVAASAAASAPFRDAVLGVAGDAAALTAWLDDRQDIGDWPLAALAAHAQRVSLYAFA